MQRRKDRRSRKSVAPHKPVRLSAIEVLEARQYLTANGYLEVPLAADQAGQALLRDPNLQGAWGVAISPAGGPVWVADNATNVASRYTGAVTGSAFTTTSSVAVPDNSPTAIAFNQTGDFTIGTGTNAGAALFFIASQNGEIDGWNTGNQAVNAVSVAGAEFTGLAVANNGTNNFLYAADFHDGKIDVFNSSFNQTTLSATAFTDSALPSGYAPYNIQLLNGDLYVTYAKQDAAKENPVASTGNGIIDIYDLNGNLLNSKEFIANGNLNVPYGMAIAPASFGDFANALLVANSGNGQILAYNATSGAFEGVLNLGPGNSAPITISGIRGLTFGNDSSAGNDTTLFYSAASGGHGQFGEILNAFDQPLVAVPTTVAPAQGQAFSGTLATLSDSNSLLTASNFTVVINWGDGETSSGSETSNGNGGFNISGTHTYSTAGSRQVAITVSDGTHAVTTTATANVTDPSFNPVPTRFPATEGQSFNGLVGSFSDPTGPGNYVASIVWGDGTSSSAGTVTPGSGGGFNVTGTHTYASVGSFTVGVVVSEVNGTTDVPIGTIDSTATVGDPNTLTATGSPIAATEGQSTTATVATFTDSNAAAAATLFSATINWGDSTTASSGTVTKGNNGVFTVTGSHAFAENGTLTATVTISDTPGTATATATSVAEVADGNTFTPQTMTIAANAGQTFAGNVATFSDTNTLVRAADFTATIDWGDSTSSVGTVTAANGVLTVSGSHSYASGGASDPVTVIITEKSPGTASSVATSTAVVGAGDVTGAGATISATASVASSPQTLGSFTPNANNSSDTFTATINWGDGTSFTTGTVTAGGGTFNVIGTHTYSTPGNYSPQVIVYESSGTATATPADVITAAAHVASPVVLTPATITAKDHTSTTLTVATFTDVESGVTASDFTATIDWGDGSTASAGSVTLANGVFTVTGNHTFAEAGTLDVSVTITQGAPTVFSTSATATATVSQDDSFTASAASLTATVNTAFGGTVATFSDTDTNTIASQLTAVINWGDGSVTSGTVTGSDGQFAVSGRHTYSGDGSFPLSVTIENSSSLPGSTESIATGSARVSPGSALTATGTTITASEGQTFSGTVATFTDTGSSNPAAAFTATINWGDGTSATTAVVSGASGAYTVAGTHVYADGGTFHATVDVVETAVSATVSAVSTASVSGTDTLTASGATVTATAGSTFTGAVAGFTDSNTAALANDFRATISWGDGSTSALGTVTGSNGAFTVTGQHMYSSAATDTVKVTISDINLSSVSASATSTADVLAATTTSATTGSISGMVFDDLGVSGLFQSSDPGLAGRTVFLNKDGSGTADGTNPQTTTDANGDFTFTGLAAGTYEVMEVIPANNGQILTTSPQTVTLTAGQTVTGVDIGNAITSTIVPIQVSTTPPPAASDANTAYINALYEDILGRAPDAAGLAYYQQQLASGASNASIAQSLWDSTEHRTDEVVEFYHEFLNRAPDAQGEQFWVNAFSSWGTEQIEVVGFLTSTPEFQNLHSGDTAFVDGLYEEVLQRPADAAGASTWISDLTNGETPTQVVMDFVFGQEASTALVDGFYADFLHRAPDSASLQMWVNDLDTRALTADQVAIQLLSSTEFYDRVTGDQAPTITSAASTGFTAGTAGSFQVTTSGLPTPSITATGLPTDVTLVDNKNGTATLASTAAAAAGTYTIDITASNGVGTAATQTFTLTISTATTQGEPAFTSAANTTFTAGTAGTFSVTTSGTPAATISETGTLPSGVTFTAGTAGTATIAGTPSATSGGIYNITLTASNGVGTVATQSFSLIVDQAPAITSTASTTFVAGTAGTFTVKTSGFPVATIAAAGLPTGVTLHDNSNGTATIASTTALAANTYNFDITATNEVGTQATQAFTLKVTAATAAPVFTSANSDTLTVGTAGTFSVVTTGAPSAALTESGTLPTGVTFADNGGGQGTLSGTPAAGTGGTYNFTITANNNATPVTQNFTLAVQQPPAITSTHSATFVAGTAGTFTVQTTGFPNASIAGTGLPGGLSLVNNGNGTATLTSTTALAANTYTFTITATNNVGATATQSFKLTVASAAAAPAFTSATSTTFTAGTAGTFAVTTTGAPSATLTESGTLPQGVTFVDNGGGQGTLSGTPAAGSGKQYTISITANNGNGTPVVQDFTLTVDQAPAITSTPSTSFVAGTAGSFTVQTSGFPDATISATGLPSGVTLNSNGNGTATITSTTSAVAGTYSATITATNGIGAAATQAFTLTIASTAAAPAFTSVSSTTFAVGTAGTFAVTTTGTPSATLSESGTLPTGVTFVDDGGGHGLFTGTPAANAGGAYSLTLTANNGNGTPVTQTFTLTVDAAPTFSSATSAGFVTGTGGTFTVSASGSPTVTITETGTPPAGVTLGTSNGGSATLTVASTTAAGVYPLTFSATNGVGGTVTQSFTLTVGTAPTFSSATSAGFVTGTGGTFAVTTSGSPDATISLTGTPPTGVGLGTSSNGSATLTVASTTPAGVYSLTLSATNGVGGAVTQSFTLTVGTAPAITSSSSATFTAGTAGSFTVTTTGTPTDTITATGLPSGVTLLDNGNNTATLTSTAAAAAGIYNLTITASNGVGTAATQSFTLTIGTAPAITSNNAATFTVGTPGSFTVMTTGTPTDTISATGLPSGVTFLNNGNNTATLASTAAAAAGTYPITITATNGVGTAATQSFTLTITAAQTAPAVTSAASTTFTAGTPGSFTVTTTGNPTDAISATGLPTGVTLVDNNNNSATLASTAAAAAGTYPITITATNGVGTAATQSFTLTITPAQAAPAFTSAASTTFTAGTAGSFTVTTTGTPTDTITATGLPSGVTLVDNGNNTATLASTTAAAAGVYTFTVTASNGVGTAATQSFTLTISAPPAITSNSSTTFNAGTPGTFTVTTTGTPTDAITATGLPSGVTLVDNHNNTATLSSTAAAAAGTYPITITATNGVGTTATQSFTLTITSAPLAPDFSSAASTTFTAGTPGSFTVTTTGNPTDAISTTALPTGVTLVDNQNNSATLASTASAAAGVYTFTITASNGVGTAATQSFTLTIGTPPQFTSNSSATFTSGTPGSFTVTTTGTPTDSITATGFPAGVTVVDNGNNTATLASTAQAAAGVYTFNIDATNGVGAGSVQSFTLTIGAQPAFTSASSTLFTVGTPGSFTVTTTGTPTDAITATDLPAGVTLVDNQNNTATLASTAAAAAGVYTFTIDAANGIGTAASQSFTLTIGTPPSITSNSSTTFTAGTAGSFTVTTTGTPTDAITATGLPSGVTLTDNGNNSATLASTSTAAAGVYTFDITATNGAGTPATQSFTLTISAAPAFSSNGSTTFTAGTVGSFTVTTTGTPTDSITATGLPTGVMLTDNNNNSATLASTAQAAAGVYNFTITASNGVGTAATQSFTLTISTPPAFTNNSSTAFAAGTAGSFTVTTTGTPTDSITATGLPTGVTLVDNNNNSATLASTSTTAAGVYNFTITASNGVGTAAAQSFTLTIGTPPSFTSNNSTAFTSGTAGSFTVTTTGTPTDSIAATGLPAGVSLVDNGNNTATLASTAQAATGTYSFNITAGNGVGTTATQTFTLTIGVPPAITSNNSTNFTAGTPGFFTVTTTGSPTDSITATGLPSGVTLNDNTNGTATLSSTAAAAAGTYQFTITAQNGVGTAATQQFTLTIS
jgi:uncharacterized protein (TIGR03118 family)